MDTSVAFWVCRIDLLLLPNQLPTPLKKCIFTARKRSLRRLCFYTCLSVILFTGGAVSVSVHAGIHPPEQTPLGADTPLGSRQPRREQTPPGQLSNRFVVLHIVVVFVNRIKSFRSDNCITGILSMPIYGKSLGMHLSTNQEAHRNATLHRSIPVSCAFWLVQFSVFPCGVHTHPSHFCKLTSAIYILSGLEISSSIQ